MVVVAIQEDDPTGEEEVEERPKRGIEEEICVFPFLVSCVVKRWGVLYGRRRRLAQEIRLVVRRTCALVPRESDCDLAAWQWKVASGKMAIYMYLSN